jgi:hypothetical protein
MPPGSWYFQHGVQARPNILLAFWTIGRPGLRLYLKDTQRRKSYSEDVLLALSSPTFICPGDNIVLLTVLS